MSRTVRTLVGAAVLIVALGPVGLASMASASSTHHPKTSSTTTTVAVATGHATHASLTPTPPCPAEDACVTIPGDANASSGTVQVGPVTYLGPDQWVYVNAYGFTPGSLLRINYCADTVALPTAPACATDSLALPYAQYRTQALPDGTATFSYQIQQEAADSGVPLAGQTLGASSGSTSFYCGDAADPCSIDISNIGDGNDVAPTAANTAIVPVSFAPATPGCADTAASVATESEYGIEQLLPQVARLACDNPSTASLSFNTDVDGDQAVASLAAGAVQVAFTDEPESPSQQSVLTTGDYKLIPVALSANVVGFRGLTKEPANNSFFPLNSVELTPTMAAGILTGLYDNPASNDPINCNTNSQLCPNPPCPSKVKGDPTWVCSLFDQLNYQTGYLGPQDYTAYVRSDTNGSTGLLYAWLCAAPKTSTLPVQVGSNSYTQTEVNTAATVLESGLSAANGKKLTTCPATTDQYPPLPQGSSGGYSSFDDPSQQSLHMAQTVPPPSAAGSYPIAAFASMNWAEARYFGLGVASIQNAGGAFVQPTTASLQAAVADAHQNADGSITPNYTSTDTAQYPMTSVIYAAVCAAPQPTAQATQVQEMLDGILTVTGGSGTSSLPDGFAPLPSSLYQTALSDVQSDVVGGGSASSGGCASTTAATTTPTTTPTAAPTASGGGSPVQPTSASPQASSTGGSGGGATPPKPYQAPPVTQHFVGTSLNGNRTPTSASSGASGETAGGAGLTPIVLTSSSSRALAPLAVVLGILALLVGGFLLASKGLRTQLAHVGRRSGQVAASAGTKVAKAGKGGAKSTGSWLFGDDTPGPP